MSTSLSRSSEGEQPAVSPLQTSPLPSIKSRCQAEKILQHPKFADPVHIAAKNFLIALGDCIEAYGGKNVGSGKETVRFRSLKGINA